MARALSLVLVAFLEGSTAGCRGSLPSKDRHDGILCTGGETMHRSPGKEGGRMPEAIIGKCVTYVETVGKYDEGPPAPLDVVFYGYSAVFNLERDHPCFGPWLAMLKASEQEHGTLVFSHTIHSMRIQSVEPGNNITGIVEEIFPGMGNGSIGFKIPHYAGIFLIAGDDPRLLDWLALIRKSKNKHVKLVVAYDAYHDRVTSLGLAGE